MSFVASEYVSEAVFNQNPQSEGIEGKQIMACSSTVCLSASIRLDHGSV